MSMNDINSLAHTKWNCKYHIVFAPKYRRKVFYGEHKEDWKDPSQVVRVEGRKHCGSRSLPRPHTYACRDTTKIFRVAVHGISQRKKRHNAL